MIGISLQKVGKKGIDDIPLRLNQMKQVTFDEVKKILIDGAKFMRKSILMQKKRPPRAFGDLEKAINVEMQFVDNNLVGGIGNINELNRKAKYWYVINFGAKRGGEAYIPPRNLGYFPGHTPPVAGGGGEEWTHWTNEGASEGDMFFMTPKVPISPMHYIDRTSKNMRKNIVKIFRKLDNLVNKPVSKGSSLSERLSKIISDTPDTGGI